MPHKRLFIKIYGDVIGVNFRHYTQQLAHQLGLLGYVKNCPDRTVEIQAEGDQDKLNELLVWANTGPKWARVDKVEHTWQEPQEEFNDFTIIL